MKQSGQNLDVGAAITRLDLKERRQTTIWAIVLGSIILLTLIGLSNFPTEVVAHYYDWKARNAAIAGNHDDAILNQTIAQSVTHDQGVNNQASKLNRQFLSWPYGTPVPAQFCSNWVPKTQAILTQSSQIPSVVVTMLHYDLGVCYSTLSQSHMASQEYAYYLTHPRFAAVEFDPSTVYFKIAVDAALAHDAINARYYIRKAISLRPSMADILRKNRDHRWQFKVVTAYL